MGRVRELSKREEMQSRPRSLMMEQTHATRWIGSCVCGCAVLVWIACVCLRSK